MFAVLLVSLRALQVPAARGLRRRGLRGLVARAPAGQHPDHPGRDRRRRAQPDRDADRLRRQQRRRRGGRARLPLPDDGADARRRADRRRDLAFSAPTSVSS